MSEKSQISPAVAFRQGTAAFNEGRFDAALLSLGALKHPQAQHLAAISAHQLGRFTQAERHYAEASRLAPTDPNIANNRGHFELACERLDQAETYFEHALKLAPGLVAAKIGMAKIHGRRKLWDQAIVSWQAVLQNSPSSRVGRYGLATALLEHGQAEGAAELFQTLLDEKEAAEPRFMLGRAMQELNRLADAESCFQQSYAQDKTSHALRNLANCHWMQGDTAKFDALIDAAPLRLGIHAIQLIIESGDLDRAERAWQKRADQVEPDAAAWILKAGIAREQMNAAALEIAADRALAIDPENLVAQDMRVVADLMTAKPDAASRRLKPLRQAAPHSQHWIAHESVADRLSDPSSRLLDVDKYVRAYDLEPPEGYSSIAAFNAVLADVLRRLHPFHERPLNQSLRGQGTQTTRSLLGDPDPVIQAYIAALDKPIKQYLSDIGADPDHPTSARNQNRYKFAGMWSVCLRDKGFHQSHVHPDGWISSAYYVVVPESTKTSANREGWINFGTPPYLPEQDMAPLKWIAPQAGQVVLFPSFMWHGTRPIAADAERITAPFDILPD